MKMFGELRLVRALTDEQIAAMREQLKAVEKRYPGLDRVICATPLDEQLADLDRFAKDVIPAFRGATAPARAAAE
jgi:hypothetical protein